MLQYGQKLYSSVRLTVLLRYHNIVYPGVSVLGCSYSYSTHSYVHMASWLISVW